MNASPRTPDCPSRWTVEAACTFLAEAGRAQTLDVETVALDEALGRVLAEDLLVERAVPPFANSAMDGFALRGADLPAAGERRLRIVGTHLAGGAASFAIAPGECLRLMTGAPLPDGADTVVIQEHVRVDGDEAIVGAGERPGANVRPAGEDFRPGETALRRGQRLGPAQLGVCASLGCARIAVVRRPRVVLLTTGDEIVMPGEATSPAQIHNSNAFSVGALVREAGAALLSHRHLPDDADAIRAALLQAAGDADLIVSCGGVSAGEADLLPGLLAEIGTIDFWKVRMKPGMPFLTGRIGAARLCALPGNPVSTVATFLVLVLPYLEALQGCATTAAPWLSARLTAPLRKRHDRTEFLRAHVRAGVDGTLQADLLDRQGSGMLRGVAEANALLRVEADQTELPAGAVVPAMIFALSGTLSR